MNLNRTLKSFIWQLYCSAGDIGRPAYLLIDNIPAVRLERCSSIEPGRIETYQS
jgi:hypothetical protein